MAPKKAPSKGGTPGLSVRPNNPIVGATPAGQIQASLTWQGPVPHPQALKAFGDIDASFPKRLVKMAEDAAAHQRAMEMEAMSQQKDSLKGERGFRERGQWFACGLAAFFGFLGGWFAFLGHPAAGASVILGTVVSLAVVFVLGRRPENGNGNGSGDP